MIMGYYMVRAPYVVNQFTWLLFQETVPETLISREDFLLTYDFVWCEVLMYPLRYFPYLKEQLLIIVVIKIVDISTPSYGMKTIHDLARLFV